MIFVFIVCNIVYYIVDLFVFHFLFQKSIIPIKIHIHATFNNVSKIQHNYIHDYLHV
jgi:hypothetical protein